MTAPTLWAVIPAAGRGTRFGGDVPKQYLEAAGKPLNAHALASLLVDPRVAGAMVALAADDRHWPGWTQVGGKPVLRCAGGAERAGSVLAALQALPSGVDRDTLVLVHDAARPNLHPEDLDRLIEVASGHADGEFLGAPVRDTLKSAGAGARGCGTAGGRSTAIDTVARGAATMKMISSTSITSTNGVTLMSLFWPRSYLPPPAPASLAAIEHSHRRPLAGRLFVGDTLNRGWRHK